MCTRELLRWHRIPTDSSEASVCAFCISLYVPIAVRSHTVPLWRLIGPSLKSQASLLSSGGFRGLPLGLTLGCQLEIWNNYSSICKILIQQCIITPICLRKPPQNSSASWDLLKTCGEGVQHYVSLSITYLGISCSLWYARACFTVCGGFCTSYTWTHPRLEAWVAILNIPPAELC